MSEVEFADKVIRQLYAALNSRPYHWLGVGDKKALKDARIYLGEEEEEEEYGWE